MKILSIDSSGIVATVSVVEDGVLVGEYTINYKKTHSQTLLPMIDAMNKFIELDLTTLDAIAVSAGPGSYTGLRIGAATAKGMAMSLNIPIVSVPTLEGMAYNIFDQEALICPMMDARRGNVFAGIYKNKGKEIEVIEENRLISIQELIDIVNKIGKKIVFLGDGVKVAKDLIVEKCKVNYSFAPGHLSQQKAGSIGILAMEYLKNNKVVSASEFVPIYLRKTQAEREYEERNN